MSILCKIDGCDGAHQAKGWCKKHYTRWLRHGDPGKKLKAGNKCVPLEERFEEKYIPVPETGCWIWLNAFNPSGYGLIGEGKESGGGTQLAHRVSWMIYKGEIPAGKYVLHKCDVPACVNPEHLFIGTQKDNMDDMRKKGREFKGL